MKYWLARYKDLTGGILMFVVGASAAIRAQSYHAGSLRQMGPGFFPSAVGTVLAATGIALAVGGWRGRDDVDVSDDALEWRAWLLIVLGIVAFMVLGNYTGLIPASFAIVFISALADRGNTLLHATLLALAMTAVSVAVFWWALKVQFPLLHWG